MPKFSVLVPVRYRPVMARLAVQSALDAERDVEVVVADNCDEPIDLGISDPRVRILPKPERVLSMPDNWDRALRAARGEWTVLLSDKERLVPGVLSRLAEFARGVGVVMYERTYFVQDDLPAEAGEDEQLLSTTPGTLIAAEPPFVIVERSASAALHRWYTEPIYAMGREPQLYNALVHRSVREKMLGAGRVFVGCSPDVSSSLAILAATDRYLHTNLSGTVIQFPSARFHDWSNGCAFSKGTAHRKKFLAEFGTNPLSRYGLPLTMSGGVVETLLAFRDARPDLAVTLPALNWAYFRDIAFEEIATQISVWRWPLLLGQLFLVTRGVPGLRSMLAGVGQRALPGAYALSCRLRGLTPPGRTDAHADPVRHLTLRRRASSLRDALDVAGADPEVRAIVG